jgi:hypothetical protein
VSDAATATEEHTMTVHAVAHVPTQGIRAKLTLDTDDVVAALTAILAARNAQRRAVARTRDVDAGDTSKGRAVAQLEQAIRVANPDATGDAIQAAVRHLSM